jgi:hypothetical protein
MTDTDGGTRWDRVARRWWLPVGLAILGGILLPIVAGGPAWTAQVDMRFPREVRFPAEPAVVADGAPYARSAVADAQSDAALQAVQDAVGHGVQRDVQVATSDNLIMAVQADSREAVTEAANAFIERLTGTWAAAAGTEIDRLTGDAQVNVDALSTQLSDLEAQLAGVSTNDAVLAQALAADHQVLATQRALATASIDRLAGFRQGAGDLVVLGKQPDPKQNGALQLLALGVIGGALTGLVIAVILARLDRKVRTARDVQDVCGPAPVITPTRPGAPLSESDLVAAAAITARPALESLAEGVTVVQLIPDQRLADTLVERCRATGVDTALAPAANDLSTPFDQIRGRSVLLTLPANRVDSKYLAESVRRIRRAGSVDVTVVLGAGE